MSCKVALRQCRSRSIALYLHRTVDALCINLDELRRIAREVSEEGSLALALVRWSSSAPYYVEVPFGRARAHRISSA